VADFAASDTIICVNSSVQFTDLSSESVTSWQWTFPGGDPSTSDQQNPVVVYNAMGEYDVTLLISDGNSTDEITKTNYIQVVMDEFPEMSLSTDNLDFDTTYVDFTKYDSILISNACADTLWVTNIVSDNPDYSVDVTEFNLPPNTSYYLEVQFMPLNPGNSDGMLTIVNNDLDTPEAIITLSGFGLGIPVVTVTPDYLSQELHPDQSVLDYISISNSGTGDLIYTSSISYVTGGLPGAPLDFQWLSINANGNGTVPPNTDLNMDIDFDATGLTPGDYSAEILLESNDLANPALVIQVDLTIIAYDAHIVDIPAGWGSISSYIDPLNDSVEVIFDPILSDLTILMNMSQVFWPGQGINTIGTWNTHQGFKIKVENAVQLTISGDLEQDKILDLNAGWNIMPVLNNTPVSTSQLFSPLGDTLIIVKEIAGNNLYWPSQSIYSLVNLEPGKAYMIALNGASSVTFPPYSKNPDVSSGPDNTFINVTPWNNIYFTANSHILAIDKNALAEVNAGDIIGIFNNSDLCCGMIEINDNMANAGVAAFGDDFTTEESIDGMKENEPMQFRLFRPSSGKEYLLNVVFDSKLPDQGVFITNGLSKINGIALVPEGFENSPSDKTIHIYPNPSAGEFNLTLYGLTGTVEISVWDIQGQLIQMDKMTTETERQHLIFDLSDYPKGIYTVKIMGTDFIDFNKIVLQ
jgi:PKD repeat protein